MEIAIQGLAHPATFWTAFVVGVVIGLGSLAGVFGGD